MNRNPLGQSFLALSCIFLAVSLITVPLSGDEPPKAAAEEKKGDEKPAVQADPKPPAKADAKETANKKEKDKAWKPLQGSWTECEFGGDGPIEIKDKLIKLGLGDPLSGVRWEGDDVLRENYEIELEARRTDGFDFFCALTFPVGKDNVSFVLGGWGGGIVGISSIDGRDASDNQTTSFRNFDNDKWYKVRVRVEPKEIVCWIDDKLACDHARKGHEFDIRYEMDQCVPLGLAAFQCDAEYRNIRVRKLTDKEIVEANKKK